MLPLLIDFFQYGLGQIYGLIVLQSFFSILQGPLIYRALCDYDKRFAFIVALMVIFDMQTRVLFNFVSTEPLYIFLLTIAFCILIIQFRDKSASWFTRGDWLLGICLALLFFTRTVGRYLILPFGLSFLIFTRSWKRTIVLFLVYFIGIQSFYFFYGTLVPIREENIAGINNEVQWAVPLFRGGLLDADNGTASTELVRLAGQCEEQVPIRCLMEQNGQTETLVLIKDSLRETILSSPMDYGIAVFRHFSQFLSQSGQQYSELSPARNQCEDIEARAERNFQNAVEVEWLSTGNTRFEPDVLRQTIDDVTNLMCPPLFESRFIRSFVDGIAGIYAVIAPRYAYILYLLFIGAVILLPYARPYLPILIPAVLITFYHAEISSLIFNVQARYAVVINVYRIILFVAMIYLVIISMAKLRQNLRKSSN